MGVGHELPRPRASADDLYKRAFQAEEQAAASKITETLERDGNLAWSMSQGSGSPALPSVSPLSPRRDHVLLNPAGSSVLATVSHNNMFAPLNSTGPQDTGRKDQDAARALKFTVDACALFRRAHAAEVTATRGHDECVSAFRGDGEQIALHQERRDLLDGHREAISNKNVRAAKLRTSRFAKDQTYRSTVTIAEGKVALIAEANAKKVGAVRAAVETKERTLADNIRCRGLRDDARAGGGRGWLSGAPGAGEEWCPRFFCLPSRGGCFFRLSLCVSCPSWPCRPLLCFCPLLLLLQQLLQLL